MASKIAFMGFSGVGKDTLYNEIEKKLYPSRKVCYNFKFSYPIKEIVRNYYGFSVMDMENNKDNKKLKNNKSIRDIIKSVAEVMRFYDEEVFTKKTIAEIKELDNTIKPDVIVVTDVRFDQEITVLKEDGFTIYYLNRDNHIPIIKTVVAILGVNFLSRFIVWCIDKKYAHFSEWGIFMLLNKVDHYLNLPDDIANLPHVVEYLFDTTV